VPPSYVATAPDVKDVSETYASIGSGATLRFRIRANPTRRIETKSGRNGERHNGRRVELRTGAEQIEWLRHKGRTHGFKVLSLRVSDSVLNVRLSDANKLRGFRKEGARRHALTFASVLFEGVLRVSDGDVFRVAMERGIGSAKAYGFGLLSVAPAEEYNHSPAARCRDSG
jgi:CRISPR system Cascade subunit CasE